MSRYLVHSARLLMSPALAAGGLYLLLTQSRAADIIIPPSEPATTTATIDPGRFDVATAYLAKWNVVLGAGAMMAPKFEGADEYKVSPIPFISASFGDRVVVDPRGVTINVVRVQGIGFGVHAGYDPGRSEDDSDHLRGLGDIDAGGVAGAIIGYELGAFEFYASVDKIIGGSDGLEGKVGMDVSHRYDRFVLRSGVSATWADDKYMEAYFGVTPEQSGRSGMAEYQAGAGFKRVDLQASITYLATEHWIVRGQAAVGYLLGDAGDSPIVQNKLQPSAMVTLGYRF